MDWENYKNLSDTADTQVTVSEQTLYLLESALSLLEQRGIWVNGDVDSTWDEIQGAIANAAQQIQS